MQKKVKPPQARLLKVATSEMAPDLRRVDLLQPVAAGLSGYPDWEQAFTSCGW